MCQVLLVLKVNELYQTTFNKVKLGAAIYNERDVSNEKKSVCEQATKHILLVLPESNKEKKFYIFTK